MTDFLRYEVQEDVAFVGIDREAKRNAISMEIIGQLHDAVNRAQREARVGILYGVGANFSAGLDLADMMSRRGSAPPAPRAHGPWTPPLELIARGGMPWVAAISGACIGGGLEIASACHLRVADETAFFALPEGKRGIFVGGGGSVRIQRLIGYARMADMMLTGRSLNARDAERFNLCQYVVPAGEALAKAKELAAAIVSNAVNTNWAVCVALPRIADMSHEDGLFFEGLIGRAAHSSEGGDRIKAFLDGADKVARPNEEN